MFGRHTTGLRREQIRARTLRAEDDTQHDATHSANARRKRALSTYAQILLRWLQRPHSEDSVDGFDLDSMSERELDGLYAGLLRVAALPEEDLQALIASLLAETEDD